jgi:hypothetical protein
VEEEEGGSGRSQLPLAVPSGILCCIPDIMKEMGLELMGNRVPHRYQYLSVYYLTIRYQYLSVYYLTIRYQHLSVYYLTIRKTLVHNN